MLLVLSRSIPKESIVDSVLHTGSQIAERAEAFLARGGGKRKVSGAASSTAASSSTKFKTPKTGPESGAKIVTPPAVSNHLGRGEDFGTPANPIAVDDQALINSLGVSLYDAITEKEKAQESSNGQKESRLRVLRDERRKCYAMLDELEGRAETPTLSMWRRERIEHRVKDEEASLLVTQKEINKLEKGYGVTKEKMDSGIRVIDLADDSDDGYCSLLDGDHGLKKKKNKKSKGVAKKAPKQKGKSNKRRKKKNMHDDSDSSSISEPDDSDGADSIRDTRNKEDVRKISKLRSVALSRHYP
jgi:hypothetical protein